MAGIVKRRYVDEAVHVMLDANLSFPIGLVDLPDGIDVNAPKYAVIQPIIGGEFAGPPLTDPEQIVSLRYDVTSIGRDRRQAAWLADEVRRVFVGRDHGALVYGLIVAGHSEMDRSTDGTIGGVTLIEGVYQQVDSYVVVVERTDEGS